MPTIKQKTDNQNENRPWLWKKGQSGNLKGRPKGKSLKEWTRDRIAKMTTEERMQFLNSISPDIQWKMAEGNPEQELMGKGGTDLIPKPSKAVEKLAEKLLNAQRDNG